MKKCSRCGTERPITDFYKVPAYARCKGNRRSECKFCESARRKKERSAKLIQYRERDKKQSRKYRITNKSGIRAARLKRVYGLSKEDWEAMTIRQGGKCAICGAYPQPKDVLRVDHCHKTDIVRDLLCNWCNLIIGWVEKDPTYAIGLDSDVIMAYTQKWGIK